MRRALPSAVAAGACLLLACRSTPTPDQWQPHESLLTVVAELELHRGQDFYRFGYPRDVTGQNVYRASLVRLANWEAQWPGRWTDIVTFAKALCFEALGDFSEARDLFDEVAEVDTDLAEEAEDHLDAVERFAELAAHEPRGRTLSLFLLEIEDNVEAWRREAVRRRGTQWEAIANVAWEQATMQLAEVMREVRFSLTDGDARYREICEQLVDEHGESHRIHRHWLRLGDHHRDLAERLVVFSPPRQTAFNSETFESLVTAARTIYLQVERADGFHEKHEARARLAALERFAARVREESR